jgi:hypothetical protein
MYRRYLGQDAYQWIFKPLLICIPRLLAVDGLAHSLIKIEGLTTVDGDVRPEISYNVDSFVPCLTVSLSIFMYQDHLLYQPPCAHGHPVRCP